MFNLIKYEFRKNVPVLVSLALILLSLEGYFLGGFFLDDINHMGIASSLLTVCAFVSFFMVFILGISNYDKELNSKSSYLIFMTPNSSLKIIISKLFYVLALGLVCVLAFGSLACLDISLLALRLDEKWHFIEIFRLLAQDFGIKLTTLWGYILLGFIYGILSALSLITLAYLAITLSTTLLQNNRFRRIISTIFFIALMIAVNYIDGKFVHAEISRFHIERLFSYILPSLIYHILIMIGCTFGCSYVINKALSL